MRFRVLIILFFIILIGLLLRSRDYFFMDFNFYLDQSRDMLLTKQIVWDKGITLIGGRSGIGGIFHGPMWLYMIFPFFLTTKGDPFWTLIPLFTIITTFTLIAAFFVGEKLYGSKVGLLFSLFLSISYLQIESAKNISNAYVMPLIFILFLYSIIRFLRGKDIYIVPAFFLIGLGFHFESAFAVFYIPLVIMAVIFKGHLPNIKNILLGVVAFIIAVSNFIFFELRHNFLMTNAALRLIKGETEVMHDYPQYADLGFRVMDRLTGLKNYFLFPFFKTDLLSIFLVVIILGFFIFTLLNLKRNNVKEKLFKEYIFILFIPFVYFFLYIFYPYPLWSQYILALTVPSSLLLSIGINNFKNIYFGKYVSILLIILILFPPVRWIVENYPPVYKGSSTGTYQIQLSVAKNIYKDAGNTTFGYLVYDPGLLTYNMDYLMWYVGEKDYGHPAIKSKLPVTYLIMYPQPVWNNSDRDYWKSHVIKSQAKILKEEIYAGGYITVQKINPNINEEPVDTNYFQNLIFR